MNNPTGYVSFVLHAHLPFIHHPESEDYLEEQWLFEAIFVMSSWISWIVIFITFIYDKIEKLINKI